MMRHRIAFYPCCARDIRFPLRILSGEVDEIIFCDISPKFAHHWKLHVDAEGGPAATFEVADAKEMVGNLPEIDVLFYRNDSEGEGGSGVFVLGDSYLCSLLPRFNPRGGIIITDGSNSRGGNFKRMIRKAGLSKHGWHFSPSKDQPWLEGHGLWKIGFSPLVIDRD